MMTSQAAASNRSRPPSDLSTAPAPNRALLACGVAAGPLYAGLALGQGLSRPGFSLARDDVSLLANGSLGWIQVTSFLVAGMLTIAARPGCGGRCGPAGQRPGDQRCSRSTAPG
jgi:hypothetical protein